MARTFLPKLVSIVYRMCVYTARYDRQIREVLEPDEIAAYEALKAACDAFLVLVEVPTGA